ncbi:lysylphosphatidylglycerol synthase transmembrane domain-containing protein [Rhodospirillum sp. A1_3_36]|uniref:lysylphosphatidylglycerol synthase transmembrane domain-containing protein n=1 Tax=Rhodospirillum sp. A1_3_36 TaxID=3391666 RepID=UPI0039A61233
MFGVLSVFLCLALLVWLVNAVDTAKVLSSLAAVPPGKVFLALLIVQVQVVLSAIRWRFTASRLDHRISLPHAVGEYYVGSFLNLVLPGGMAGDAVRAYRTKTGDAGGWKRPAAAVFLERLSGQLAFFLLTGLGLLAWPAFLGDHMPEGYTSLAWICLAGLLSILGLGVALAKTRISTRMEGMRPHLLKAFWQDGAFAVQVGLSTLIVAAYVITFLIAADAVGTPLPAVAAITVIPLCLMTMLIPAGIGGWGTREAAAAALWPLLGYSSAQGLSASLLYGVLSLVGVAPIGLAFLVKSTITRNR